MQLQTIDSGAIEKQAMRAYFRRLGKLADQPNQCCTEFFERDGKQYVRLANINRNLATYRITRCSGGGWRLRYVDADLNGTNEWFDVAMDEGDIDSDTQQEPGQGTSQPRHGEPSPWWSLLADLPTVGPIPADKLGASH